MSKNFGDRVEPVDYDRIAGAYESRYDRNAYSGVDRALTTFVPEQRARRQPRVLEIGCGTGHWLRFLDAVHTAAVGVDLSWKMLKVAKSLPAASRVVRARAEGLPFTDACFDRIFCVNALHHFADPASFFVEARRVLSPGGGLLTIGLDPGRAEDRWWIYDYFPEALTADRQRYPTTARIRDSLETAGFSGCETVEVHHLSRRLTVPEAERQGFLDRTSTSQLMVISDAQYEEGLRRIHAAAREVGNEPILCSDLRLYGTTGWVR